MKTLALPQSPVHLQVPGVAEFTATGALINASATGSEILALGKTVNALHDVVRFWIGDILNATAEKVEHGSISQDQCDYFVQTELGLTYADVIALQHVASVPHSARRANLSAAHHRVIGRLLKTAEEQIRWLEIAVSEGLTVGELASSITAGQVTRQTASRGKSIHSATEVVELFLRFKRQLFEGRKEADLNRKEAFVLLAEFKPLADFLRFVEHVAAQDSF